MYSFYRTIFKNSHFYGYFKTCALQRNFNTTFNYVRKSSLPNWFSDKCLKNVSKRNIMLNTGFLTWLGLSKEDEDKESELITTIKRSILLMQRGELTKAEQMLHLALRLAQEQGSSVGITYVYDLMANLALERSQYEKAEKLFVNVLQRMLTSGIAEDDIKVIHISLKLARINQKKNEPEKAELGYKWCLETIQKHLDTDTNAVPLQGVILDWYASFLAETGNYKECLNYLQEAYKIYSQTEGIDSEKFVLLLNDLGTASWQTGNYEDANNYLSKALYFGKKIDGFEHLGIIYANLGLVKLKQGILAEAQKFCKEGWSHGKKINNVDAVDQANYCFEQIKAFQ